MSDVAEEGSRISDVKSTLQDTTWLDENIPEAIKENVAIKHLDGPLFFGFASGFTQKINQLPEIKYVVIRMEKVPFMDQTGLYALEEAILSLEQKNVEVLITGLQQQPAAMMRRIKIIPELVGDKHIFRRFNDAINFLVGTIKAPLVV